MLTGFAVFGLLVSGFALLLMVSTMAGTPLWPIDGAAVGAFLGGGAIGTAWLVRMVMLAAAGAAAVLAADRAWSLGLIMVAAAVALATLAWTGHGAMNDGVLGWAHLGADILHLVSAGAWVGALLGLLLLLTRPVERVDAAHLQLTYRALHGFGTVGTVVVGTVVVTGLINTWVLIGPAQFTVIGSNLYGRLLIVKLVLFLCILGLAALNRYRLTPAFENSIAREDHRGALLALRASLGLETGCVVVILGLVSLLGTLAPPRLSIAATNSHFFRNDAGRCQSTGSHLGAALLW